jgi:hypothetical protein
MKDFYNRLSKVSAEDRATVADMQREGAPAATVWGFLGQAEERHRVKLQAEKGPPTTISKLYTEADRAEASGQFDQADTLRKYARMLSEGGRGRTPEDANVLDFKASIRAAENKFRQMDINAKEYDALRNEAISKLKANQASPAASPTTTPATPATDPLGIR